MATVEQFQSKYSPGSSELLDWLCQLELETDVQKTLAEDYFHLVNAFTTLLVQQENDTYRVFSILSDFPFHLSVCGYFSETTHAFQEQVSCLGSHHWKYRVIFQITKQWQVLEDFGHLVRALETQVR